MRTFAQKRNQPRKPAFSGAALSRSGTPGLRYSTDALHHQRTVGNELATPDEALTYADEGKAGLASTEPLRFGHDFSRIPIQTKLAVSGPGDEYERAADSIAEQVMQMPEPQLQRACACDGGCPESPSKKLPEEHARLQPKYVRSRGVQHVAEAPIVDEVLSGPGRPLDPAARAFMEPRFRHDFSHVRVHTDERAGRSADAVAAQAYTVGSQIVFGQRRYAPATRDGRRLLAHELAHIVQQATHQVIARQPASTTKGTKAPVKSKTVFHPGVKHDHQPSGRWADVQKNPRSPGIIGWTCAHFDPEWVMRGAGTRALYDKPLASKHLAWFFQGGGADFVEDANLELMLRTDSGVQAKITKKIPTGRSSGTFADHVTITQDDYSDEDFQYSFGEIDRLDFEIDFNAGTLHAWFQDRYEWHPVYPFYQNMPGDYERDTNCIHAAAVELKSSGAKDYWMKGETTIPLKAIQSAASRKDGWRDPLILPGA
jgi:hypothetical protein